jgi:hypothetical protein
LFLGGAHAESWPTISVIEYFFTAAEEFHYTGTIKLTLCGTIYSSVQQNNFHFFSEAQSWGE